MKLPAILIAGMLMSIHVAFSQSPQAFKYQAVARDSTGTVLSNTAISLRISIIRGSVYGSAAYAETHNATTNSLGLINLEIGSGDIVSGSFSNIDWGTDKYFVKVEMDATGGNNYITMGISQLLSVPYALYAEKAGNVKWQVNSPYLYYNGGKVGLGTNTPVTDLHVQNNSYHSLIRIQSATRQSGLELVSGLNSNPFINFGKDGEAGSKGGIYCDVTNNQIIIRANKEFANERELVLQDNGNLGVGKKFPYYKLDVAGDINFTGDIYKNGELYTNSLNLITKNGQTTYFNNTKVGIGTNNAFADLHLYNTTDSSVIRVESSVKQGGIQLISKNNYSPFIDFISSESSSNKGRISFDAVNRQITLTTDSTFSPLKEVVISQDGNLGIGTKTPKAKIEIQDGDIYINNSSHGIILKSPDGNCWRVTIDNNGEFQKSQIDCP